MADARLTVLLPVRHYRPAYLRKALDSILGQTAPRWRLVVIDDGADDGLRGALGGMLLDERVRLVANERQGFASALNTGLRTAETDFVSLLFADDLWTRDAVGVLTSFIERFTEVDLFHASRRFIDERDRAISRIQPARESFTLADFQHGSPVKNPICCRRERALAVGGMDESLDPIGVDDYDFPWSMASDGARFMAIPDCLYLVRDHRDSFRLTTHVPRSVHVRALRRIMRKHGVGRARIELRVVRAKRSHLRQCLYRSPAERWLKERLGHDPRGGWRESYARIGDRKEARFAFGENWLRFLDHIDDHRVRAAKQSLRETLRVDDLVGRSFLDAGSGSGLLSLAAARLDASSVHSFDRDADSVACARLLKERYAPHLESWTIEAGDVTDPDYCAALGEFDVVCCLGVLSYAGSIWRGLDQLTCRVAPGGLLVLSVYNDQGPKSDRWRKRKRRYNALAPRLRPAFAALVWLPFEAGCAATGVRHEPRAYLRSWTHPDRGVSRWHDIVAWVGGYPFQVARPEPVIDRCRAHGFDLVGLSVSGGPRARTEFVFRRSGRGAARAE